MKKLKLALAAFAISLSGYSNADIIELSLVLDSSGSVGGTDWAAQVQAYENIFTDSNFYADFVDLDGQNDDTLWVNAIRFSSGATEVIGFTEIDSQIDATNFGDSIGLVSYSSGQTHTDLAVDLARDKLVANNVNSIRSIIDVSTDGEPYWSGCSGSCALDATNTMLADILSTDGIRTNFIGIGSGINQTSLDSMAAAGGGFSVTAPNFGQDFEDALSAKLYREIQGVPGPGTLGLFGLSLIGLGLSRRRRL